MAKLTQANLTQGRVDPDSLLRPNIISNYKPLLLSLLWELLHPKEQCGS